MNELKEFGYLHIYQNKKENGQFDSWIWEYDDEPFLTELRENQNTENQQEIDENLLVSGISGNQTFGFPDFRETRSYSNKDYNNKDYNNTKDKEIIKDMSEPPQKKPKKSEIEKEFEKLWKLYPRKEGKKIAKDKYIKVRQKDKVSYETIENGIYRYIRYLEQHGTDDQYIPHGSTWFNQEKWQDELTTTGVYKKPKNSTEYLKMKYGGNIDGPNRNGEIIEHNSEVISEFF